MSSRPEKIVNVDINLILDPTLLRALKLIESEEDILSYSVNGNVIVPLKIKFKNGKQQEEVEVIHHGRSKL